MHDFDTIPQKPKTSVELEFFYKVIPFVSNPSLQCIFRPKSFSPQHSSMAWELVYYGLFLFLLVLAFKYVSRRKIRLPPGPPAWPFAGHIHLLGALPHHSLSRLSKIYGPLMYLRLGSVPTIVVSSPYLAKEFFRTYDHIFANRPKTAAGMLTCYGCSDIAWAPYGSHWKQVRKICLTELFSAKRLEMFGNVRQEEVDSFTRTLLNFSSQEKEVEIRVKLSAMANNVISRMVMNKRYFDNKGESSLENIEFKEIIDEIFVLNGVFNIGDYMPYIKWLDLQGYEKRMKKVSKRFDVYLGAILEEHRNREGRRNGEPTDFIDLLLNTAEDSNNLETKMTDNHLKGFVLDMFGAGTDTFSVTVEWALTELLKNPSVMEKAKEELDEVVGRDRLVRESDISQLKYLNAIVKETMRLHPAAPLLMPHESMEDCKVGGYDIPAKTRLFVNVWAIARDPNVWENASSFEPERFLREKREIDVKGQHYELIPFGSGRRGCPGMSLGLCMLHLVLARSLHAFDWVLPPPFSPHDMNMSEMFGLTVPKAQPLLAIPHARLPPHVYTGVQV